MLLRSDIYAIRYIDEYDWYQSLLTIQVILDSGIS